MANSCQCSKMLKSLKTLLPSVIQAGTIDTEIAVTMNSTMFSQGIRRCAG